MIKFNIYGVKCFNSLLIVLSILAFLISIFIHEWLLAFSSFVLVLGLIGFKDLLEDKHQEMIYKEDYYYR